jgi:pimeloyl-ACP methyl ester carboxylesterase
MKVELIPCGHWAIYNSGLTRLTDEGKCDRGVVIAKGCGHFIQVDDPVFVAEEIEKMVGRLGWS